MSVSRAMFYRICVEVYQSFICSSFLSKKSFYCMYILTKSSSQISELTSPGFSTQDIMSSTGLSTPGVRKNNHSNTDEDKHKSSKGNDSDDSHHDSESFNIYLKKNVASKAAVRKLNIGDFLNETEDDDDDSYVPPPEKLSQKKTDATIDYDFSDNDTYSEDDSIESKISLEFRTPNLSKAERLRSQMKPSTTRSERKRKIASVSSSTKSSSISFTTRMNELKRKRYKMSVMIFHF